MHVRRSARDLAKRWRLERAVVARIAGNGEPSFIRQTAVAPGDTGIVELLIGEVRTDVAGRAATLAAEHLQSCFLESA